MAHFSLFDRPARSPDDRGTVVPLLSIRDLKRSADGSGTPRAALAAHLQAAVKAEARRATLWGIVRRVVLLLLWIGVLVFVGKSGMGSNRWIAHIAFWGGLVVVVVLTRSDARRRFARQLSATAVAEGVCGSCAYSLESLAPEPDGCLVCPECGAAWRGERVTRPHWDTTRPRTTPQPPWWLRFITGTPAAAQRLGPDDRGRFVPVFDSRLLSLPPARREELGPEMARALRRRLRRIGRVRRGLNAAPMLVFAAFCVFGMWGLIDEDESGTIIVLIGILTAVFVFAAVGLFMSHRFIHPRVAADAIREFGLCAGCARSLTGLRADPDGCVTCPECGSGWRVAPPVTPMPGSVAG